MFDYYIMIFWKIPESNPICNVCISNEATELRVYEILSFLPHRQDCNVCRRYFDKIFLYIPNAHDEREMHILFYFSCLLNFYIVQNWNRIYTVLEFCPF